MTLSFIIGMIVGISTGLIGIDRNWSLLRIFCTAVLFSTAAQFGIQLLIRSFQ